MEVFLLAGFGEGFFEVAEAAEEALGMGDVRRLLLLLRHRTDTAERVSSPFEKSEGVMAVAWSN